MVFPTSNLPTASVPWAREIEKQLSTATITIKSNELNNSARDSQLASTLSRLNSTVGSIKTITDAVFVTGTTKINGYNIKAGTIDASTINAGTFRTSDTGQRVVMSDLDNIKFYDSNGTLTAQMQGTAGIYDSAFQIASNIGSTNINYYTRWAGSYFYLTDYIIDISNLIQTGPTTLDTVLTGSISMQELTGLRLESEVEIYLDAPTTTVSGPITIGTDNPSSYIYGAGGWIRTGTDGSGEFFQTSSSYGRTYSGAANGYVTTAGTLGRSTSAAKYKMLIEEKTNYDFSKILQLKPKTWFDKNTIESHANYLTSIANGEEPQELVDKEPLERISGLIAEDLVDAGLEDYVIYGAYKEDGTREVEGIQYDRLWTCLIPLVKDLRDRLDILENK